MNTDTERLDWLYTKMGSGIELLRFHDHVELSAQVGDDWHCFSAVDLRAAIDMAMQQEKAKC